MFKWALTTFVRQIMTDRFFNIPNLRLGYAKCLPKRGKSVFSLLLKSLMGALVVLLIAVLSKSKLFYIAGLVPLFPTFALIAHVIVAQQQGAIALQKTALFGLWALIPYFIYLLMVYVLATKFTLPWVLGLATIAWIVAAVILIYLWQLYMG